MSVESQSNSRGWGSVHQRLKKYQLGSPVRIKLRDWANHPVDPAWENGTYSLCHDALRRKVQSGDLVFDAVYPGNPTKTEPVIRSVFCVEAVSDGVLSFDEFIFLDGDASEGVDLRVVRDHSSLTKTEVDELLRMIKSSDAYSDYSAGSKPESIPEDLWQEMLEKAGTCSPCTGDSQGSGSDGSSGPCPDDC